MSETAKELGAWRARIISDPDVILEDRELMRALIAANEAQMGTNIVDLRGVAMERLERRLDRLEDTHRSVIAAAYENLAGTNQIQRAVLALLDPADFEGFLRALPREVMQTLRVDRIRLVLESALVETDEGSAVTGAHGEVLKLCREGWIDAYAGEGRHQPRRQVTLRQVSPATPELYDSAAQWIQSEALLRLDLGAGRLPALLVLGSEDPHQFRPNQGTDLLAFFAGVFERVMRRWLS